MKNLPSQIILSFLLGITILLPKSILAASNINDETLQFKIIIGQKLKAKIDEVFAHTPQLLTIYNKIQNTELAKVSNLPEYQNLLNSKELKLLNNSPEMQEAIKEVINDMNTQVHATNQEIEAIRQQIKKLEEGSSEQNQTGKEALSAREVKKAMYDKEAVINELKRGISNALETFNNQLPLYFLDAKLASNTGELPAVQKPDTLTTDTLLTAIINLDYIIDTRITASATNFEGLLVSSGDEYVQNGLWIKGLKSQAKQSEYQLTAGYKSNQQGVVIGLDFMDNVGFAYAFIKDQVKSNIPNTKERIDSHFASIYGLYKFDNDLLIDMQTRYGRSNINKSRNNLNLSNNVSYAKTKGNLYGGKLELGYDFRTQENVHIVPAIGIGYDELQIDKYQEKGAGLNRKVAARRVNKTTGLVGIKISKAIRMNSFLIIPAIHVKSLHTLAANNDKTTITILTDTKPLITPSNKLNKTIYMVGSSLKVSKSQPLNIEIGYDFGKSRKFTSHTGYISAIIAF